MERCPNHLTRPAQYTCDTCLMYARLSARPVDTLYLVTRGNVGIMVLAPNAGQAYERAIGYGFPMNTASERAIVTRLDGEDPTRYTLNVVRSRSGMDNINPAGDASHNPTRKGH